MKACKNCRYGGRSGAIDGVDVYFCRFWPPKSEIVKDEIMWVQPPMRPEGWCGQFKLAFFRWLGNFALRGT